MELHYSHDYSGLMWSVEVPWTEEPLEVTVKVEAPLEEDEAVTVDGPQAAAIRLLTADAEAIHARIHSAVSELLREQRAQEQAAIRKATEEGRDAEEERALGLRDDYYDEEEDYAEGSYEEPDWWGDDEDEADEEEDEDDEPSLDVEGAYSLDSAEVSLRAKGGVAYLIFHGSCTWDEEHGLSVEYHPEESPGLGGYGDFR